jgi:hypothetical protein
MKRMVTFLIMAALLLVPALAAAQTAAQKEAPAPAATPATAPAPQAAPAPQQPQAASGACCPSMTPEQMKQMQGKMGQGCMMQPGQGCPMHQQMQKQLDELQKRVEALEGKAKGKKK